MLNASRPTETIATLHALKRRIYLWALAGSSLADISTAPIAGDRRS